MAIGPPNLRTSAADSRQRTMTQWYERNRFALHAEQTAPYDLLLVRLGADRLAQIGRDWQAEGRESGPQTGCLWFEQTSHNYFYALARSCAWSAMARRTPITHEQAGQSDSGGAITPFLQGEFGNGKYQLVTDPHPLSDGGVYAFIATVTKPPDSFSTTAVYYKLWQGAQTDRLFLRDEPFPVVGQALWANENSGVLVDMLSEKTNSIVAVWIPLHGGPLVELGPLIGDAKQWAQN